MIWYNNLNNKRQPMILEADLEAALICLNVKAVMVLNFFCKYSIDEDNRLANLFWANSIAHLDYSHFRIALTKQMSIRSL